MEVEILGIEHFNLIAENDAEVALLNSWAFCKKITAEDISTEDENEPKTIAIYPRG